MNLIIKKIMLCLALSLLFSCVSSYSYEYENLVDPLDYSVIYATMITEETRSGISASLNLIALDKIDSKTEGYLRDGIDQSTQFLTKKQKAKFGENLSKAINDAGASERERAWVAKKGRENFAPFLMLVEPGEYYAMDLVFAYTVHGYNSSTTYRISVPIRELLGRDTIDIKPGEVLYLGEFTFNRKDSTIDYDKDSKLAVKTVERLKEDNEKINPILVQMLENSLE